MLPQLIYFSLQLFQPPPITEVAYVLASIVLLPIAMA